MPKKLENLLIDLKLLSNQYSRNSKKFSKKAKSEKTVVKRHIEKGEPELALAHAENSIKYENMSVRFLRLSFQLEHAYNVVNNTAKMGAVSTSMKGIVKVLESTSEFSDMKQITGIMDRFEKECENAGVAASYMEGAMDSAGTGSAHVGKAAELVKQVAEEHGLEFNDQINSLPGTRSVYAGDATAKGASELEERLRKLQEL